jgi:hypothetical protein
VAAENYLANLALYPGRCELLFLPSNTQVKKKSMTILLHAFSFQMHGAGVFLWKAKNKNQVFVPAVADFDFELSNLYLQVR